MSSSVVNSMRRFARRRRWRWTPSKWTLVAAGAVLVLAAATWVVLFSRLLVAQEVSVRGADHLGPQAVAQAARVPAGVPLARVELDAVADRVAALAAVHSVRVTRRWPHTVEITVTERRPVGQLVTADGVRAIDATGAVFPLPATADRALPRLVPEPSASAGAIIEAAKVVARLPAVLNRKVEEVHVSSRDAVTMHLRNGDQAVWGSADDSKRKARVLTALLRHPAAVYDVTVPELPTTTGS